MATIDPRLVKWDDAPAEKDKPKIDPRLVKWEEEKRTGTGNSALDAGNALGTGYFNGLIRSTAGLPMDFARNVVDLGKAAIGAPYIALTGKVPPEWLQLSDRKEVPLTSDWMIDKAKKTQAGKVMLEAANPDYEGGYLQAIGSGLSGVRNPGTKGQLVNQTISNTASPVLGKAVYDATGNQALAIAASMSPNAVQQGGSELIKRTIRGGEEGRQKMEQRITDLRNAGVDNPTMGLASGNQVVGGVENILQNTPGAVNVMRESRNKAISGMQDKTQAAAGKSSAIRGSLEAGQAIQNGVQDFRDSFKAKQNTQYAKLDQHINPQEPVNVSNTLQVLGKLNADIPGAPELSKQFKNSRIQSIEQAMKSDTAGAPQTVMVVPQPPKAAGGLLNQAVPQEPLLVTIPAGPSKNTLPWEAVKKTRTLVGDEIADTNLTSSVPRSKWSPFYGALSSDMEAAANNAGSAASNAFKRANDLTRAGMNRLDKLQPFVNKDSPEKAYHLLNGTLGDNASTLQAVKKSLSQDARGTIAGTVIENLGKAAPGQQNNMGDAWSSERFLTNWNRMSPKARDELFSGFKNSAEVKADVEAVAKASSMMRENSKLWANPSGTAANTSARLALGSLGVGGLGSLAGWVSPTVPIAVGGGMLLSNLAARGLTNKNMVDRVANKTIISPQMVEAQINGLLGAGLLNEDRNKR